MEIAQRKFIINAPRERVWELLGRIIYRSLPLERMEVVTETSFRAVLNWRLAGLNLPLKVKVSMDDISPPEQLGASIKVKKGIIDQTVLVSFALTTFAQDQTELVCNAATEGGAITTWLLGGQQRRFAGGMFDTIRVQLERLC